MKKKKIIAAALSIFLIILSVCPTYATVIKAGDNVMLGGMPFGVKFFSGTMTVSGFAEVDSKSGNFSPAQQSGMRINDVILKLNNKTVTTAEEVIRTVEESQGKTVTFLCNREGKDITFKVQPALSSSTGTYKIGIWIKDSTAGIGTVTYIVPKTGEFGGLGHGICSTETGELLSIRRGIVTDVTISGITKGECGTPGELKGFFSSGKTGIVTKNSSEGVFGIFSETKNKTKYKSEVKIASKEETHSGKAIILCTLASNEIKEYDIEIQCNENDKAQKSFSICITDMDLIKETFMVDSVKF